MHGVLRCNIFSAWFLDIRTYQLVYNAFNQDAQSCVSGQERHKINIITEDKLIF